jgi:hypothetical protein
METEESLYYINDSLSKKNLKTFGIDLDDSDAQSPVLIFGNVTLNSTAVKNIQDILKHIPKILCLVLLLSEEKHSHFDLGIFDCRVYIIPHLYSSGPLRVPKIPIAK